MVVEMRPPVRNSYSAISVIAAAASAGSGPTDRFEVDAGLEGWEGPRGQRRVGPRRGDVGADTARMIPTMSGLARPEILATAEWLAEHLGRVRILDARWRPDGTGSEVHRAGHIPGAVSVDWRADLVDMDQAGDAIQVASPGRVAATAGRAGIGDETTIVVYDDTQGLYASRIWWTFRTYGAEHVRILDGSGFPAWEAEGRPVERGAGDSPPGH